MESRERIRGKSWFVTHATTLDPGLRRDDGRIFTADSKITANPARAELKLEIQPLAQ